MQAKTLHISSSPHISKNLGAETIMQNVVIALLPVALFSVYAFGINAMLVLITATLSCLVTEHVLCLWSGKESTISDWSSVITGLLLGLTLPPSFPLWMTFMGGVIAVALGKFAFGGLGYNAFNPALVGRAFLQAAFPVAITTWHPAFLSNRFNEISQSVLALPFMSPTKNVDAMTGATPLAAWKFEGLHTSSSDLALGLISGSAGETCGLLILLGGVYLVIRNMMNWRIPIAVLGTVFTLSGILYLINPETYPSPMFMLFSGGLMLGAVFMASDMVGSPMTSTGIWIYGSLIGLLVVVIRIWGGLPEGVMYAILFGNAITPLIDKVVQPRVYGTNRNRK